MKHTLGHGRVGEHRFGEISDETVLSTTVTHTSIPLGEFTLGLQAGTVTHNSPALESVSISGSAAVELSSGTVNHLSVPLEFADQQSYQRFVDALIDNNPNEALNLEECSDALYAVIEAAATALTEVDNSINEVERGLSISNATSDELELLGEAVGQPRPTSELDDKYRVRVNAAYGQASSDATIRQFASVLLRVLETDAENVSVSAKQDVPVVEVTVPGSVVTDSLYSETELESFLSDSVPSTHGVEITTT